MPHRVLHQCHDIVAGRGFHERIPRGLPNTAIAVFENTRLINQALDQCRHLGFGDFELCKLAHAEFSAHHHLLSLPRWEDFEAHGNVDSSCEVYECYRLTSLL